MTCKTLNPQQEKNEKDTVIRRWENKTKRGRDIGGESCEGEESTACRLVHIPFFKMCTFSFYFPLASLNCDSVI